MIRVYKDQPVFLGQKVTEEIRDFLAQLGLAVIKVNQANKGYLVWLDQVDLKAPKGIRARVVTRANREKRGRKAIQGLKALPDLKANRA